MSIESAIDHDVEPRCSSYRPPLNDRERQVLDALRKLTNSAGMPPMIRELSAVLPIRVTRTHSVLRSLVRKGYLRNSQNKRRSYVIA